MRVGIVGAGVIGLALHHYLHREGVDSTVLEADGRPGGVIESGRVGGRVFDYGPQWTRLTLELARLVDALDLRDRLLEVPDIPLSVYPPTSSGVSHGPAAAPRRRTCSPGAANVEPCSNRSGDSLDPERASTYT